MKPGEELRAAPQIVSSKQTDHVTGGVQSITRALSILDVLAESEAGLTLALLSKRVALPPSSTHRLLTTLQRRQFVAQFTLKVLARRGSGFCRRQRFRSVLRCGRNGQALYAATGGKDGRNRQLVRSQRRRSILHGTSSEPANDRLDFAPRRRPCNASVSVW